MIDEESSTEISDCSCAESKEESSIEASNEQYNDSYTEIKEEFYTQTSNDTYTTYTEIREESWFSRIVSSIVGMLIGFLLFIIAFPVLWWNEGYSVMRYNSLKESQGMIVSVPSNTVNFSNNNKLIHTQGLANTSDVLNDDIFPVSVQAIRLERLVSMYQWDESKNSTVEEHTGGSRVTKTVYTYNKKWADYEIQSNRFKKAHHNPPMPYKNQTFQASNVNLGAFKLNVGQINRISGSVNINMQEIKNLPSQLMGKKLTTTNTGFYLGDNPANPQIGDLKIGFKIVPSANISVIAQQQNDSFNLSQQQDNSFDFLQTYNDSQINLLEMGFKDVNTMIINAEIGNTINTWAFRLLGFLLMWIGIYLILNPLATLAAVLPLFGDLVEIGISVLSFSVSFSCAMLVISTAWITYHPLIGSILIVVAIISLVSTKFISHRSLNATQN